MGFDAIHEVDSLDAGVAQLVSELGAVEHHLVRNTDDCFNPHTRHEPDFVAFHHLWVITPHGENGTEIIAVAFLIEWKSHAAGKTDVSYKWISEDNGPSAIDCPVAWLDRVPAPSPTFAHDWRYEVRHAAHNAVMAARRREKRAAAKLATGLTAAEHNKLKRLDAALGARNAAMKRGEPTANVPVDWTGPRLSKAQRELLAEIRETGKVVTGSRRTTAEVLQCMDLATVTDNGRTRRCEITERGLAELRKWRCPGCGMLADFPAFDHGEQCGACADAEAGVAPN